MNWFRAYPGISNDTKLALIAKRLKVPKGEVLALWVSALDFAAQNQPRGSIQGIDPEQLSEQTDFSVEIVKRVLAQFREKEMVAKDGTLTAWAKRQYTDYSSERVKRHRERQNKALTAECNAPKRLKRISESSSSEITEEKQGTEGTVSASRISDDDDRPKTRPALPNPSMEFHQRMSERHGPVVNSSVLLQQIEDQLGNTSLAEFLEVDSQVTGSPHKLRNPAAHYMALAQRLARGALREILATTQVNSVITDNYVPPKCCTEGRLASGGYCSCDVGELAARLDAVRRDARRETGAVPIDGAKKSPKGAA